MIQTRPSGQALLARWLTLIQSEYREMPGLHLTPAQARRLWGLDDLTTRALLSALVDSRFLRQTPSGAYVLAECISPIMMSRPAAGHAARRISLKGLRPTVIALTQNQQSAGESTPLTVNAQKSGRASR